MYYRKIKIIFISKTPDSKSKSRLCALVRKNSISTIKNKLCITLKNRKNHCMTLGRSKLKLLKYCVFDKEKMENKYLQ